MCCRAVAIAYDQICPTCCRAVAIAYDHNWEASSQSVLVLSFTQVAVSKQKGLLQTTQASQLAANAQTATAARIRKYALQSLAEVQANSQGPTQAPPDTQPGIADSRNTQVRHWVGSQSQITVVQHCHILLEQSVQLHRLLLSNYSLCGCG